MDEDVKIRFIIDRYETDELCEVMGLTSEDIVMAFYDRCLEIDIG